MVVASGVGISGGVDGVGHRGSAKMSGGGDASAGGRGQVKGVAAGSLELSESPGKTRVYQYQSNNIPFLFDISCEIFFLGGLERKRWLKW